VLLAGDVAELGRVPLSVNKTAAFSNNCVTLSKRFSGHDVCLQIFLFISITINPESFYLLSLLTDLCLVNKYNFPKNSFYRLLF